LYFDNDHIARFLKKKVDEGTIEIEGKKHDVDDSKHLLLKTQFGYEPLYILKWDCMKPAQNIHPRFEDSKITPEIYRKMMNLKILGNMIKVRKDFGGGWLYILIGVAVGAMAVLAMIMLKVI
jgi:hypothetical protein